jgi:hypothetical protein
VEREPIFGLQIASLDNSLQKVPEGLINRASRQTVAGHVDEHIAAVKY